ncbi:MAG: amino acid ABC transporter permease [Spirochaetales bacterium]|nr:amino acid ABC transporter permease [Spirochaetales bacterium]
MTFLEYAREIAPVLSQGAVTTLIFTFIGMGAGFILAVPLCLYRIYGEGFWKKIICGYVEIIRGTPMLVQLYMIYYGLPKLLLPMGIRITPFAAAILGFVINSTAYQIGYMQGGFKAIPTDQIEAAHSLGMKKWQTVFRILAPQGLRFSIPALSNELIYLLKYTSLGFVIQAPELMTKAKILASDYARYMETYIITAFIYILLTFIFTKVTDLAESRLRIPGFESHRIR